MKIRLIYLALILALLSHAGVSNAEESEYSGWITQNSGQISLSYPADINLRKLESRLRSRWFTVSASERDRYSNQSYPIESRILSRLESILLRVEEILAMYPENMEIKIRIYRDREELSQQYSQMFGSVERYKSFYVHPMNTIFTSMTDVTDSEMSHEMAHAVIDNYFRVVPPSKTTELLATYVDSHLERE